MLCGLTADYALFLFGATIALLCTTPLRAKTLLYFLSCWGLATAGFSIAADFQLSLWTIVAGFIVAGFLIRVFMWDRPVTHLSDRMMLVTSMMFWGFIIYSRETFGWIIGDVIFTFASDYRPWSPAWLALALPVSIVSGVVASLFLLCRRCFVGKGWVKLEPLIHTMSFPAMLFVCVLAYILEIFNNSLVGSLFLFGLTMGLLPSIFSSSREVLLQENRDVRYQQGGLSKSFFLFSALGVGSFWVGLHWLNFEFLTIYFTVGMCLYLAYQFIHQKEGQGL